MTPRRDARVVVEKVGKATGYNALNENGMKFGLAILRAELAAVRRVVRAQKYKRPIGINAVGYFAALDDLLAALRGKR